MFTVLVPAYHSCLVFIENFVVRLENNRWLAGLYEVNCTTSDKIHRFYAEHPCVSTSWCTSMSIHQAIQFFEMISSTTRLLSHQTQVEGDWHWTYHSCLRAPLVLPDLLFSHPHSSRHRHSPWSHDLALCLSRSHVTLTHFLCVSGWRDIISSVHANKLSGNIMGGYISDDMLPWIRCQVNSNTP